jgi:hypothetical protein
LQNHQGEYRLHFLVAPRRSNTEPKLTLRLELRELEQTPFALENYPAPTAFRSCVDHPPEAGKLRQAKKCAGC